MSIKRNLKEKKALIEAFNESGLSLMMFCKKNRVAYSSIARWIQKEKAKKHLKPATQKFLSSKITQDRLSPCSKNAVNELDILYKQQHDKPHNETKERLDSANGKKMIIHTSYGRIEVSL
jgi:hypothetical protein